ncbi:hypothetical protein LTR60_005198, partial [Cryomyces antarcticus]
MKTPREALLLGTLLSPIGYVFAACECGYIQNNTALWTSTLHTNFTQVNTTNDWAVQERISPQNATVAPYGITREIRNVEFNPASSNDSLKAKDGSQAGLLLYVRSKLETGSDGTLVPAAEIRTTRRDIQYGSFRAGIHATNVKGTCGAFFWYLNDTQEIDMELLSAGTSSNPSYLDLSLQSEQSFLNGGNVELTPAFKNASLPFIASEGTHEYRFDWTPNKVSFYVDGSWLYDMTGSAYVPISSGQLILNHWSNGNAGWSGGPPKADAKMTVTYVTAYFNSTDAQSNANFQQTCRSRATQPDA